jgi:hypothetical protein
MQSLQAIRTKTLIWVQPSRWRRSYELLAGDDLCAELYFRHAFRNRAMARAAEGTWTLDKPFGLKPIVRIHDVDSDADIGVFTGSWRGGGTLSLHNGKRYQLSSKTWLPTDWVWSNDRQQQLLHYNRNLMTIVSGGGQLTDVALLACVSWYVHILVKEAVTNAATGVAASRW